jgi:FKBP-type peptidyl-prolyl cis-trans isomerase SlyD
MNWPNRSNSWSAAMTCCPPSNGPAGPRSRRPLHLNLEPENAFGDYDETRVHWLARAALPPGIEEGMLLEAGSLPAGSVSDASPDALFTITEIYPEHVVIDGNHPLAGIALRLHLKVERVREATVDEVGRGSAGTGFFRLQASAPASPRLH